MPAAIATPAESAIQALPAVADEQAELPGYDPYLRAFHNAFAHELEGAVAKYKTVKQARVLDVPCGDGFYTALFAKHMQSGELVAADLSPTYLARAERVVRACGGPTAVRFVTADAYALPFDDESFDMVWCAQSMVSLDDPVKALKEMRRVLKPRGVAAVLETDEFHHIILPWPVGLELAIQRAVRAASKKRFGSGGKLAQARKLHTAFLDAGLTPTRKATVVADRQAPFDDATRAFLREHFDYLRKFVRPELPAGDAEAFDRCTDEGGPESLLDGPDAELTCLATISHARR